MHLTSSNAQWVTCMHVHYEAGADLWFDHTIAPKGQVLGLAFGNLILDTALHQPDFEQNSRVMSVPGSKGAPSACIFPWRA